MNKRKMVKITIPPVQAKMTAGSWPAEITRSANHRGRSKWPPELAQKGMDMTSAAANGSKTTNPKLVPARATTPIPRRIPGTIFWIAMAIEENPAIERITLLRESNAKQRNRYIRRRHLLPPKILILQPREIMTAIPPKTEPTATIYPSQ